MSQPITKEEIESWNTKACIICDLVRLLGAAENQNIKIAPVEFPIDSLIEVIEAKANELADDLDLSPSRTLPSSTN